jgi:hypothetical protein
MVVSTIGSAGTARLGADSVATWTALRLPSKENCRSGVALQINKPDKTAVWATKEHNDACPIVGRFIRSLRIFVTLRHIYNIRDRD